MDPADRIGSLWLKSRTQEDRKQPARWQHIFCFAVTSVAQSWYELSSSCGCSLLSQPAPALRWNNWIIVNNTAPARSVNILQSFIPSLFLHHGKILKLYRQESSSLRLSPTLSYPLWTGKKKSRTLSNNLLKISAYAKAFHVQLLPASFKTGSHDLVGIE